MFIEQIFITAQHWEQPRCPSAVEWENADYCKAVKVIKLLLHITVWINLPNIILQCGYAVSSLGRTFNLSILQFLYL